MMYCASALLYAWLACVELRSGNGLLLEERLVPVPVLFRLFKRLLGSREGGLFDFIIHLDQNAARTHHVADVGTDSSNAARCLRETLTSL